MSSPKIILLDDDAALRQALTFALEIEGYEVEAFETSDELITRPDAEAACLVFDYRLDKLNGLDVLETLRGRGVAAPAILITSNPKPEVRARAARLQAAVVEKPLLGDLLVARLREIVPA
ncbi:response regulator [Phenylobacterium sp.]|uniref:response regulator n=1 Tax=Phenylobacterium sp. TaxID=1871053 RepID=UPI002FDB0902